MNKRQISIIFLLKTRALYWDADGTSTKLFNIFLIFKTPELGSRACCRESILKAFHLGYFENDIL